MSDDSGFGKSLPGIGRETLAQPSCRACYHPGRSPYCLRCEQSGAAKRHQDNHPSSAPPIVVIAPVVRPRRKPSRRRGTGANQYSVAIAATPAAVIAGIQAFVVDHGEVPSIEMWKAEQRKPCHSAIYRLYGTWGAAVRAAGYEPRPRANQHTRQSA